MEDSVVISGCWTTLYRTANAGWEILLIHLLCAFNVLVQIWDGVHDGSVCPTLSPDGPVSHPTGSMCPLLQRHQLSKLVSSQTALAGRMVCCLVFLPDCTQQATAHIWPGKHGPCE